MYFLIILVYVVIYCVWGSVWGWAVNKVIENKGYRDNWFWWGFFFGMIAMLVALTKPDLPRMSDDTDYTFSYGDRDNVLGKDYVFKGFGHEKERKANYAAGEWRCAHCRSVNAGYVGTCGCGWDKSGNAPVKASAQQEQPVQPQKVEQPDQQPPQKEEQPDQQPPQMLYCTSCGKQMQADSKFCRYCGAKAGV